MYLMIDKAADLDFMLYVGFWGMIVFLGVIGITAIIEAAVERKMRAEERRRACKRYNTAIRPARRY
jgi:hypothetical protein